MMKINLNNCFEEFMLEKKSYCEDKTIEYYDDNLKKFLDFVADQELTKSVYIDYITKLRKKNIKNTSIRTYCRAVRVFSNWLCDNNFIDKDFTYRVKLPRQDADVVIPLSQTEIDIIDSCFSEETFTHKRNLVIIHLMLDAGLRRSEVINLRFIDIDFSNKLIIIKNSKYNKSRIIPLSNHLEMFLIQYLSFFSCSVFNSYDFLIQKNGTNQPVCSDTIKNIFRKLKSDSGIQRLHAHLLRHTFATSYLMQGGNLEQLRIILGHSDYNVTRHYLHMAASNKLVKFDIYKLDDNIIG